MWLQFLKLDQRRVHKGFPALWFAHSSRLVLTKLPAGKEKEEAEKEKEEQGEEEEGNESSATHPGGLEARGCPTLSCTSPPSLT